MKAVVFTFGDTHVMKAVVFTLENTHEMKAVVFTFRNTRQVWVALHARWTHTPPVGMWPVEHSNDRWLRTVLCLCEQSVE